MKNKLSDLNDHLFAQMERLSDESLTGDNLRSEIDRAKAVSSVATQIIGNARLVADVYEKFGANSGDRPDMLKIGAK